MAEEEGARKGEALPQDLQDFLNDFDQTYEEARKKAEEAVRKAARDLASDAANVQRKAEEWHQTVKQENEELEAELKRMRGYAQEAMEELGSLVALSKAGGAAEEDEDH